MHRAAIRHLSNSDPTLAALIARIGKCDLKPSNEISYFEALARSIVYQQLSGKAAATIFDRFAGLFPDRRPTPEQLLACTEDRLRSAGLSKGKAVYVRDLASRVHTGQLDLDALPDRTDGEVIENLTSVKGIGVWTAQMFLLFRLGRPDVLPDLDLGVQKAIRQAYRLRKHPTPRRVQQIGAKWAPYRSVATWYLWRSIDGDAAI